MIAFVIVSSPREHRRSREASASRAASRGKRLGNRGPFRNGMRKGGADRRLAMCESMVPEPGLRHSALEVVHAPETVALRHTSVSDVERAQE